MRRGRWSWCNRHSRGARLRNRPWRHRRRGYRNASRCNRWPWSRPRGGGHDRLNTWLNAVRNHDRSGRRARCGRLDRGGRNRRNGLDWGRGLHCGWFWPDAGLYWRQQLVLATRKLAQERAASGGIERTLRRCLGAGCTTNLPAIANANVSTTSRTCGNKRFDLIDTRRGTLLTSLLHSEDRSIRHAVEMI